MRSRREADWLSSPEGERTRYRGRQARRLVARVVQEPRSKGAIKPSERAQFWEALRRSLQGRRAFRSPVALQLDLYATRPNPPAIHTVAKNYIDLMYTDPAGARVMRDDRQVQYLAVRYGLAMTSAPFISVGAQPMRDFLEDVRLVREGAPEGYLRPADDELGARLEDLRYWDQARDRLVAKSGEAFFEKQRLRVLADVQRERLAQTQYALHRALLALVRPGLDPPAGIVTLGNLEFSPADLAALERDYLLSPRISAVLAVPIQKPGDTKRFKEEAARTLQRMTRNRDLFPLQAALAVTILTVRPKAARPMDLDNLARTIIPLVHDILKPPRPGGPIQKFPPVHLTRYEVVEVPRVSSDPADGWVRIALCEGTHGKSFGEFVAEGVASWVAS